MKYFKPKITGSLEVVGNGFVVTGTIMDLGLRINRYLDKYHSRACSRCGRGYNAGR
jgi:hypothetical protein